MPTTAATLANADFTFEKTGNVLSANSKTLDSYITYRHNWSDAAGAASRAATIKTGAASTIQGVYTNMASVKQMVAYEYDIAGSLSTVATVGVAITALLMAF